MLIIYLSAITDATQSSKTFTPRSRPWRLSPFRHITPAVYDEILLLILTPNSTVLGAPDSPPDPPTDASVAAGHGGGGGDAVGARPPPPGAQSGDSRRPFGGLCLGRPDGALGTGSAVSV